MFGMKIFVDPMEVIIGEDPIFLRFSGHYYYCEVFVFIAEKFVTTFYTDLLCVLISAQTGNDS